MIPFIGNLSQVKKTKGMISGKRIISVILILFLLAITGACLLLMGLQPGMYLVYFSVSTGAVLTMIAGVAASPGKVEKDF